MFDRVGPVQTCVALLVDQQIREVHLYKYNSFVGNQSGFEVLLFSIGYLPVTNLLIKVLEYKLI